MTPIFGVESVSVLPDNNFHRSCDFNYSAFHFCSTPSFLSPFTPSKKINNRTQFPFFFFLGRPESVFFNLIDHIYTLSRFNLN